MEDIFKTLPIETPVFNENFFKPSKSDWWVMFEYEKYKNFVFTLGENFFNLMNLLEDEKNL